MRRISIGSWAYGACSDADPPAPIDQLLPRLAELEFDGLELDGYKDHPNPKNHPNPEDRDALVEKLKRQGLEFSGFAPDLSEQHLLDAREPTAYLDAFRVNVRFASDLQIKGIRVDSVQPPSIHRIVDYADLLKRLTTTWDYCINYAADHGLYVAWEFEPRYAFNKPSDVQRVLDHLQHDGFGVLYDTCHAQIVAVVGARQEGKKDLLKGGQLEFISRLSGRINHVHLSDSDDSCRKDSEGNDENSAHLPLGDGRLHFDELAPALASQDLDHDWWTVDLCGCPDVWDATARSKDAIDELNNKYS